MCVCVSLCLCASVCWYYIKLCVHFNGRVGVYVEPVFKMSNEVLLV